VTVRDAIELFDAVALTEDIPAAALLGGFVDDSPPGGLVKGQVGTVVEVYGDPPEAYEVEFVDSCGDTYALLTLRGEQLLLLHYEPVPASVA
jgi:hypothetical protein